MQAWKFPKLLKEISKGRIILRLRIHYNSQRLLVEYVYQPHDLLFASGVVDVHIFQETVIGTAFVAGPCARDTIFLEVVTEVPGVARDDKRDSRFILQNAMVIMCRTYLRRLTFYIPFLRLEV